MQPCSFIVLSHPHTYLCVFVDLLAIPTSPSIVNVFVSCIYTLPLYRTLLSVHRDKILLAVRLKVGFIHAELHIVVGDPLRISLFRVN